MMWVCMGMMAFLAAAYILPLPLRFVGGSEIPDAVPFRLTLFGLFSFMPGIALGVVLGLRTYRAQKKVAARSGTVIGAALGWTSFFVVDRLGGYAIPGWVPFFEVGGALSYALLAPVLAATALVLYALFSKASYAWRLLLGLVGIALAALSGAVVLVADFGAEGLACALISAGSGALGGWVAGIGYARAGGNEMIPPGAVLREPEQSQR